MFFTGSFQLTQAKEANYESAAQDSKAHGNTVEKKMEAYERRGFNQIFLKEKSQKSLGLICGWRTCKRDRDRERSGCRATSKQRNQNLGGSQSHPVQSDDFEG